MPSTVYAITGAGKGLGLEMCRQLLARGDAVYALVRTTNDALAALPGVKVVEGIDVTKDDVGETLKAALDGVTIDVLVNNAGAFGSSGAEGAMAMFASQKLDVVSMEAMRDAFEINTLGPLKVSKALLPQITAPGGKIAIVSTLMGSMEDNTSGGSYAYRTSKAAVNMVGKSLAEDLKEKGVYVSLIHPGMVKTNFAGDGSKIPEGMLKSMHSVEESVVGMLQALDAISESTTGSFVHANYGNGLKPCPW